MKNLIETLHIAWTIAAKDVREAVTNKGIRTNMLVLIGLVLFFYWSSSVRPFDKRVDVVVYDEGGSNLAFEKTELSDGSELDFRFAESLQELEKKMEYQDLGLVIPADINQQVSSAAELNLSGYIFGYA